MELVFRILAVVLIGITAYFLWNGNGDAAFVSGVLGAVAFFLSIRFEVKGRLEKREEERAEEMRRQEAEEADALLAADAFEPAGGERRATGDEQKTRL
jgi:hypothetical protein